MAKEATTIYIDDSAIRALVTRGKQARKWGTMPLEPGLVKDGVIQNEDAVAAKVKELWQAKKIGARKVIAGISGINCLHRLLTLPQLPRNLLPEAVRREAGRALGVPLEQLYLSWQALPSLKGETLIYLAASPRNSVDALISVLRKAGLNPYLMDLKPLALARTTTESRAIIIDLQPGSFDIVVMAQGIPEVMRSVPLPREALLEGKVAIIKEEVDRAITFYNSHHRDKPIEASVPLLVCGELAEQQDVWKLLTGKQKRPVRALPSPIETPEGFPAALYMTNIGLALKTAKEATAHSLVNLNALPEVYLPTPRPISEILFVPTIIAGIALVALGAYVNITASPHTTALHTELASISEMVASHLAQAGDISQEITARESQASSLEATVQAFTTTLRNWRTSRNKINGDLGEINSSFLPETLRPEEDWIEHKGDMITVKGRADNENAVFTCARKLRGSRRFALVVITDMHLEEGEIGFTLTLTK